MRAADGPEVQAVCRRFLPDGPLELEPLRGAGFSGSRVYRVLRPGLGPAADLVCKAFTPGTDEVRVQWIHRLMRGLRGAGVSQVPAVTATAAGATFVTDRRGTHWELTEFRAGRPTDAPTHPQVTAALESLARLHQAALTAIPPPAPGKPACMLRRIGMARRMLARPWAALRRLCDALPGRGPGAISKAAVESRLDVAIRLSAPVVPRLLPHLADLDPPGLHVQAVLRDVWSDHVLFTPGGATVTGIIDYHAAAFDSPATDIARLLGSWRPPTAEKGYFEAWLPALAAYDRVRPLDRQQQRLIPVLAATSVLFGLDNWFRWLIEEERHFPRPDEVLRRIDRLLDDLPAVLAFLDDRVGNRGLTG